MPARPQKKLSRRLQCRIIKQYLLFSSRECIRLLGANDFRKAYEYLKRVRFEDEGYVSEDSIMDGLKKLVGKPRDCFLVDQLIFLEKQEEISKQSFGE